MTSCPKPEPRAVQKARQQRVDREKRRQCVCRVWERDEHRCRFCRMLVIEPRVAFSPAQPNIGHVNEHPMRSKGGDPTDPRECFLTCQSCHDHIHRKRRPYLYPHYVDPLLKADGLIRWGTSPW